MTSESNNVNDNVAVQCASNRVHAQNAKGIMAEKVCRWRLNEKVWRLNKHPQISVQDRFSLPVVVSSLFVRRNRDIDECTRDTNEILKL